MPERLTDADLEPYVKAHQAQFTRPERRHVQYVLVPTQPRPQEVSDVDADKYYTEHGSRKTLKYIDAPVARGAWHTLRVEFAGTRIAVSLDGKRSIEFDDKHISGPGAVGVWTKADSVTAFDDFVFGAAR